MVSFFLLIKTKELESMEKQDKWGIFKKRTSLFQAWSATKRFAKFIASATQKVSILSKVLNFKKSQGVHCAKSREKKYDSKNSFFCPLNRIRPYVRFCKVKAIDFLGLKRSNNNISCSKMWNYMSASKPTVQVGQFVKEYNRRCDEKPLILVNTKVVIYW